MSWSLLAPDPISYSFPGFVLQTGSTLRKKKRKKNEGILTFGSAAILGKYDQLIGKPFYIVLLDFIKEGMGVGMGGKKFPKIFFSDKKHHSPQSSQNETDEFPEQLSFF